MRGGDGTSYQKVVFYDNEYLIMADNPNPKFIQAEIENVFQKLVTSDINLKKYYDEYMLEEYQGDLTERLPYYDIARVGDFIRKQYWSHQIENFETLFNNIEEILQSCDQNVAELIVIGLFEQLQSTYPEEIDYYIAFNKWLKPLSKKDWDELIDFWEGTEWRNKK